MFKKWFILAIAVVAVMATVLGCKGKKETGGQTAETTVMPSQDFVGSWSTDGIDYLEIHEINAKENKIVFELGSDRDSVGSKEGTAKIEDGKIKFVIPEWEEATGTMEFNENGVTIIPDDPLFWGGNTFLYKDKTATATEQAADSGTETTATATNFTRVIELKSPRMNGQDIVALQKQLLSLGYDSVGEADGYYGPATEKVIKYIQFFGGQRHDMDGKVNQSLWNDIFEDFDPMNLLKRGSFAANTAIDASTVLDVFQKFIEWKDIDRDIDKIANGLLNNREYAHISSVYDSTVEYYFSPEHNLVLRGDFMENAPRREFILPDFRKFIHRVYHGLTGWHSYDEIYDFDPQTGVFTLLETIDYEPSGK